jgi:hypothetical protein
VSELEPTKTRAPARNDAFDLEAHEQGLLSVISGLGLPSEGVLVPVSERLRVFTNISETLQRLTPEHLARSVYLSKYLAAVASGLFDAALNYLWDETVGELRRRIANYDLEYFFDLAVGTQPERRKKLRTAEDLVKVEDHELVSAALKMGLISDVGYRQLDLVRHMRNHASAAHPNQVELRALQVLEYLETCIVEVIMLPETSVVVEIKKLLGNVKQAALDPADVPHIAQGFAGMGQTQADNLGEGLFGIYLATTTDAQTRTNVRLLFPLLWPYLSEDVRHRFGIKYSRHLTNGDAEQTTWARELLDVVDARRYLPEHVRVADIDAAVDALIDAHRGWNNFRAEIAPARELRAQIGPAPDVPGAVRTKYVHALIETYLGNPYGVSHGAESFYIEMLEGLTTEEALVALRSINDVAVASTLQSPSAAARFPKLLELLKPRVTGRPAQELLEALETFTGDLSKAAKDSRIKRLLTAASA